MNKQYAEAKRRMDAAQAGFDAAQVAYRAMAIGDAEYLAARAEYAKEVALFDAAFAREAGWVTA